jgi:hypothetical protein
VTGGGEAEGGIPLSGGTMTNFGGDGATSICGTGGVGSTGGN